MKTYFKKAVAMLISIATIFCVCFVSVNAATTYKTTVKENSFSTIKNVGSGKMLNVYGSKSANNTNVTVYSNDNTNGQKVKATPYNGGYYFTFKCSTSRALNIYGTSCKESANVCIWNLTKNPTQLWIVEYVASKNAYVIRSKSNKDYCLTANGSSNSSNVCVKKYTGSNYQLWTSSLFSAKANTSSNSTTNSITNSSGIVSPCTNRKISSSFQPWRRIDRSSKWGHMGIDYTGGSSIVAFYKGTVTKIWYNSSTGYSIEIKHSYTGKTFYSYYFHLKKDSYKVSQGTTVSTGQQIATMGSTGESSGVHLHFQITSKSVVNSSGKVSVYQPGNNNKDKTKDWQSRQSVFSWNNIKWYNPEIVLTKGLNTITNN